MGRDFEAVSWLPSPAVTLKRKGMSPHCCHLVLTSQKKMRILAGVRLWEGHGCCGCCGASEQGSAVAGSSQWLVVLERTAPHSPLLWLLGLCTEVEAGACCCPAALPALP